MTKEEEIKNILSQKLEIEERVRLFYDLKLYSSVNVEVAILHSKLLDDLLDLNSFESELSLAKDFKKEVKTWIGLDPQTLQTPFSEIFDFLSLLKEFDIKSIVDFGAGYGRVGVVSKGIFPESKFLGYEYIQERCELGNKLLQRVNHKNYALTAQDISQPEFLIPKANLYFAYDFSDVKSIKELLEKLNKKFDEEKCFLVVRGKSMRSIIQTKFPEIWALNGVFHHENWSLYSSFVDLDELRGRTSYE